MSDNRYTLQLMQLEKAKGELRAFVMTLFEVLDSDYKHTSYDKANNMVEKFIKELEDNFG